MHLLLCLNLGCVFMPCLSYTVYTFIALSLAWILDLSCRLVSSLVFSPSLAALDPLDICWTGFITFLCLGLLLVPALLDGTWDLYHACAAATCGSQQILPHAAALLLLLPDMGNISFPFCRNSK